MRLAAWLRPDPLGELTAPPQTPYLDFMDRGTERRGREGRRGMEGTMGKERGRKKRRERERKEEGRDHPQ